MSGLRQRIAKLENAEGAAFDVVAFAQERLAKARENKKRAASDPEFAAELKRKGAARQAQLDRDFREGRLTGHELKLYLVKKRCRELKEQSEERNRVFEIEA